MLEVNCDRATPPPDDIALRSPRRRGPVGANPVDTDHVGAQISQQHGRERSRSYSGQLDHAYAGEGAGGGGGDRFTFRHEVIIDRRPRIPSDRAWTAEYSGGVNDVKLSARGAATRMRIVESAAVLMYQGGTIPTSLDDVLSASGTGKSQLYHYFRDKADLVSAVIEHQIDAVLREQADLLAEVVTTDQLRAWAAMIVEYQRQHMGVGGCPIGSLAAELADRSETYRTQILAGFTRWQDLIHAALRRIQDSGELGGHAPVEDLAPALLTALQGGLLMTQTTRDVTHLRLALDLALTAVDGHRVAADAPSARSSRENEIRLAR